MRKKCSICKNKYLKTKNQKDAFICPYCGNRETNWTIKKIKKLFE